MSKTFGMAEDLNLGVLVLVANDHWRKASLLKRTLVFLFARRDKFDHLGNRMVVGHWFGKPFLISIKDGSP